MYKSELLERVLQRILTCDCLDNYHKSLVMQMVREQILEALDKQIIIDRDVLADKIAVYELRIPEYSPYYDKGMKKFEASISMQHMADRYMLDHNPDVIDQLKQYLKEALIGSLEEPKGLSIDKEALDKKLTNKIKA